MGDMRPLCQFILINFGLLYLVALVVALFPTDPLSGVFLIALGLPWSLELGPMFHWAFWVAPLANLLLLFGVCQLLRVLLREYRGTGDRG